MLSDLDNIADFTHSAESTLKNIDAILADGSGPSTASDQMAAHVKSAAASLDVSSANIAKATEAFAATATSTGATQDDINQIMDDFTKNFMKNAQDQIASAGHTLTTAAQAVQQVIQGIVNLPEKPIGQASTSITASDLAGPNPGQMSDRTKAYYDAEAKAINALNAYGNALTDKTTDPATLDALHQQADAADEAARALSGINRATADITKGIDVMGTTFQSTNASMQVLDAGIGAFGQQLFEGSVIIGNQIRNLHGTADEVLLQAAGLTRGDATPALQGMTGWSSGNFKGGSNPFATVDPASLVYTPHPLDQPITVPVTVTGNSFMTTGQMDQIAEVIMNKVVDRLSSAGLLR
jgi:hypothetical protein